jgi:hypothetical protein
LMLQLFPSCSACSNFAFQPSLSRSTPLSPEISYLFTHRDEGGSVRSANSSRRVFSRTCNACRLCIAIRSNLSSNSLVLTYQEWASKQVNGGGELESDWWLDAHHHVRVTNTRKP